MRGGCLQALAGSFVGLGLETFGANVAFEEAGEDGLDQGAEDDLSASVVGVSRCGVQNQGYVRCLLGLWQSHVHDEDEFEGVVEWEPVDGIDHGFEDGEEGVDDPVLQFTSIVSKSISGFSADSRDIWILKHTVSHWVSSALPRVKIASSDQYAGRAKPAVLTKNSPAMLKKTRKKYKAPRPRTT